MLHLSSLANPIAPELQTRHVLCNSWPKAGTHLLLELARLAIGDGGWYAERDIKYPQGDDEFIRQAQERLTRHSGRSFAIKGHFGRTPGIESFLAENHFAHLFAVRDPREVLCSTWRWLRDLRPDWAISRHLAPLDPAVQLEQIICGLPLLHPFDADRAVRWDRPLPDRYADLSLWLDSPDCEVLAYEDLSGMRGVTAQFAAVERALRRLALPYDHTDIARIAGLICNPSATTFHTGPASDWEAVFTDRHRHLFVELGGEAIVERLGYPPTLPSRSRPPRRVEPDPAAAPAEIRPADDLRAFVDQLRHFFGTPTALQIEFAGPGKVLLTAHQAGSAVALAETATVHGDFPRLPLADGTSDMVFSLGSLATLDDFELSVWLPELRRIAGRHLWVALDATPGRDREWWEARFIAAGWRKHALNQCVVPYELLNDEGAGLVLLLDAIPARVLHAHPIATTGATPGARPGRPDDMLREAGIHSEASLARYTLAREYVRQGQAVLDAACGSGAGCAVLATGTDAARIIGVDASASAIRYARDLYGSIHGDLEFLAQDPARLAQLSDESVDLVISFDTLENQPDPDRLLREFARVLKPGGLFIGSVPNARMNAHGPGMVADLSRAWDHERLRELVSRHFDWRELYRQSGGVDPKLAPPRLLRSVEGCTPGADDRRDTDCWIAVAAKPDTGSTGSASPRGTRLDAA